MLKISVLSTALGTILKLEGKLSGPGVAELEACWHVLRSTGEGRPLCVDLGGVGSVSSAARQLLESMAEDGTVIVECDCHAATWSTMPELRARAIPRPNRLTNVDRQETVNFRPNAAARGKEAAEERRQAPVSCGQRKSAALDRAFMSLAAAIGLVTLGVVSASFGTAALAKALICFMFVLMIGLLISGIRRPATK